MMSSPVGKCLLLGSLAVLLWCGSPTQAINPWECNTYVRMNSPTLIVNVANYVLNPVPTNCDQALLRCYQYIIRHLNFVLGNQVAPITNHAAEYLCLRFEREILPSSPADIYAYVHVKECSKGFKLYLGLLCCWKYIIRGNAFFIPNPECKDCEKPPCESDTTLLPPSTNAPPYRFDEIDRLGDQEEAIPQELQDMEGQNVKDDIMEGRNVKDDIMEGRNVKEDNE